MAAFDLVYREVSTDSYLKEYRWKVEKLIQAGEYPPEELTEGKIIEILCRVIFERKKRSPSPNDGELSDEDLEFYWKILWVTLEEQLSNYQFIEEIERRELQSKLQEAFNHHISINQV